MTRLLPFLTLVGRASVFWMGLFWGLTLILMTVGMSEADSRAAVYVNGIYFAIIAFPGCAGWLGGIVIQEFQHTTFADFLPGVRSRVRTGFIASGLFVTLFIVTVIGLKGASTHNLAVLFFVGLGSYCLGGVLVDPISGWVSGLNAILALALLARSQDVARFATLHPWWTGAIFLGCGAAAVLRLFARSTFRRKPFLECVSLPGSYSLEKTGERDRRRRVAQGPRSDGWHSGYLGSRPWRWVRAAIHEAHGANTLKDVGRVISRLWGIVALVLLYAWIDKGELGFGEAVARSIYDALFRSPHLPQFSEKGGPFALVMIIIAGAGVSTALFSSVTLGDAIAYPLSRLQRARVHFRGGLVDGAFYLLILGPFLFATGHLLGLLVGIETRFDFFPFFLRPLLITLILMPLAHRGRLALRHATRRKAENTLVGVIFGVVGFIVAVAIGTFVSPRVFLAPVVEIIALTTTLLVSQLLYRWHLIGYYRETDLV